MAGKRGSRGRPSPYQKAYARQAERLCQLGLTDVEIADFFSVTPRTIYRWKHDHPEFCQALTRGKEQTDDLVEQSLLRRAMGYSHDAVKILQYEGAPVVVPYVEHYPPDTTAAIFWLKNRRPDKWRDKPDDGHGDAQEFARSVMSFINAAKCVSGGSGD